MAEFTIGAVYRDATNRLFLAVTSSYLLSCNSKGKPRAPVMKDDNITTRGLADAWGMTVEELDDLTQEYFPRGK